MSRKSTFFQLFFFFFSINSSHFQVHFSHLFSLFLFKNAPLLTHYHFTKIERNLHHGGRILRTFSKRTSICPSVKINRMKISKHQIFGFLRTDSIKPIYQKKSANNIRDICVFTVRQMPADVLTLQ